MLTDSFGNGIFKGDGLETGFEEDRFAVKGFVVDYFTYRLKLSGYEWSGRPVLPYENLLEYSAMREVALIFEKKYEKDMEKMISILSGDVNLTFQRYVEVMEEFFCSKNNGSNVLSYGQLVTIVSFGGLMITELVKKSEILGIDFFAISTSTFLDKRIKSTWSDEGQSWPGFFEWSIAVISSEYGRNFTIKRCLQRLGRAVRLVPWPSSLFHCM